MKIDLDKIERDARAATGGEWTAVGEPSDDCAEPGIDGGDGVVARSFEHYADAVHAANVSPKVALAMVEELRRLRGSAPQAPAAPTLDSLTPSQRRIFDLVVAGRGNREIAAELRISVKTVDAHRSGIHRRLGTHTAADLVRLSVRLAEVSHG